MFSMQRVLHESTQLACQYFELIVPQSDELTYQVLLEKLSQQINHYLNHDFQTLLNALYRIDVDESKFKEALALGKPNEVAGNVAKLILDRIMLKAEMRLRYKSNYHE